MAAYVAPLQDMHFVLKELAGIDEVAALPGNEEVSPDLVEAILDEAGKFAGDILSPINATGDRQGCKWNQGVVTTPSGFKEAYRQFIDNGWAALAGPVDFGGQGLPHLVATPVHEMLKSANLAFSLCPMLTVGAVNAMVAHASEALKQTYLRNMVSGKWTGTMNLTEPQAGSDLSAVRTRAIPNGDHYRLFGTKIFITWGEHDLAENIIHMVLARLPDAPEGVKGISLFLTPKYLVNADGTLGTRNDLQCASIEHKMGIHASPTAVMVFGDKEGAVSYLVGEPNRGLEYMFTMMNHARLAVGLEGVALAERAYQQALTYANERVQGAVIGKQGEGKLPISHHPDVRRMLMNMKSQTEAMRALSYVAEGCLDKAGHHPDETERRKNQALVDLLTPVVKGWSTEQATEIASLGIQVHGGMGFIEETGAAQFMRDARITSIYEGTTGIQAMDLVGRKVAREKGVTAKALIVSMRETLTAIAALTDARSRAIATSLQEGVDALEEATDWVLATFAIDPAAVAAGSVPYLKLFGVVAGGWQMARSAVVANARLAGGEGDAKFYRNKIATARFYADHILPQASSFKQMVVQGAQSVMESEEALT